LLIFTAGGSGWIRKWERLQLNVFMYSQEVLPNPREDVKTELEQFVLERVNRDPIEKRKQQLELRRKINERLNFWKAFQATEESVNSIDNKRTTLMNRESVNTFNHKERQLEEEARRLGLDTAPLFFKDSNKNKFKKSKTAGLKVVYYEALDLLLCGYEDSKICAWGYNEESTQNLPTAPNEDGVSNRVSGLTVKYLLQDHHDSVLSLCAFTYHDEHYLVRQSTINNSDKFWKRSEIVLLGFKKRCFKRRF
jgi:hypothetical protein